MTSRLHYRSNLGIALGIVAILAQCIIGERLGAAASQTDTGASPAMRSLQPPVILPDGTEFKSWEQPLRFTRTYYVNGGHPKASDANPGSRQRPFATINRAAQVLQPGERVVVASGIYREWVRPARGGTGPDEMISYEAAPGATVVIKGSRVFQPDWVPSTAVGSRDGIRIWEARLSSVQFGAYNPFAIDNVTPEQFAVMDWATPLQGKAPYTLPRGLVFQDGKLLQQVEQATNLLSHAGAYWVDRTNQTLHVRLAEDKLPGQVMIELATQESVFAPEQAGLGYIRIKGFTIEHAAGPFPWEQVGAISTTRGHHWLIEDNVVRWANGVGIDLGTQHPRKPQPDIIGFHIVRRNVVTDCGICGICGLGPGRGRDFGLLIEDNVLCRNAFYDVERLYETGAIKTHNNIRCVIRRNLIVDTWHGADIWMDWNNQFSRCTQNIIIGSHTIHGGIFLEASYKPNLVDHNIIWNTEGHGIYEHDSTGQIFAHNLIGYSSKSGFHLHGQITDRRVDGRNMTYGRHTVRNNVLVSNARPNEFLGEPSEVGSNVQDGVTAQLDSQRLVLTWAAPRAALCCQPLPSVTHDFYGKPRKGSETLAGPFLAPADTSRNLRLWPLARAVPEWPLK
ncbi:MAG TPA: right-handed parallel beta-helix repeat-containing protein [Clostridia bacterium]|nr:right-handed parallel beta-helix repeat-containing protein [Clostridia bacterium]